MAGEHKNDEHKNIETARKIRGSTIPFVAFVALFVVLSWRIISPLGGPLAWSVMLSYFALPFYRHLHLRLFKGKHANVAAALTTVAILFFLFIPTVLFILFLTKEGLRIFTVLMQSGLLRASYTELLAQLSNVPVLGRLVDWLDLVSGMPMAESIFSGAVNWLSRFVTRLSGEILGNAFKVFYLIMVVTISSFFIVRDGHIIIGYIKDVLPLSDSSKEAIVDRAAKMLRAVVYGIVFTASVQGALGGLGWYYAGLPNATFFGFTMFITGMIPFVGTPIVWVPGVIYLLLAGKTMNGFLLLAWGLGVVSTIDNFIRPYFISEGSKMNVLVIFIGIIGGLYNWGFLGLFLGPLILSLALFMLDVYRMIIADHKILGGTVPPDAGDE